MSDADRDPFTDVFGQFRAEIDDEIHPYGASAARVEVRRRARRRGVVVAIATVVVVAVPIVTYAATSDRRAARAALAHKTSPASARPSVSPQPSASASVRTIAQTVPGRLIYISRAGKNANQFSATLLTVSGNQVTSEHIGDPAWNQAPPLPKRPIVAPDTAEVGISPDGTRIAFAGNSEAGLDVANTNGSDFLFAVKANIFACGSPIWAPDSTRVVYTTGGAASKVTVSAADGSGRRVIGPGCYPIFTTNGQIAYIEGRDTLVTVNADGSGRHAVSPNIGTGRIRTIMSVAHGLAIIDVEQPSTCGCDDATRRWTLTNPYVLDLATGALSRLPTKYGHVRSAFYGADGGLVLRTGSSGTKPGTVVILAPNGTVRATFDESALSTPAAKVDINHVDLVGYAG